MLHCLICTRTGQAINSRSKVVCRWPTVGFLVYLTCLLIYFLVKVVFLLLSFFGTFFSSAPPSTVCFYHKQKKKEATTLCPGSESRDIASLASCNCKAAQKRFMEPSSQALLKAPVHQLRREKSVHHTGMGLTFSKSRVNQRKGFSGQSRAEAIVLGYAIVSETAARELPAKTL